MLSRIRRHWWRVVGGLALVVGSVGLVAPASAHHGSSHSLQLVSIVCLDKEDDVGRDEPFINVAGITVWKGDEFTVGTSESLLTVPAYTFKGTLNLDLWENDVSPNADDFLGRAYVFDRQAGTGNRVARFTQHGALYEITYRVNY